MSLLTTASAGAQEPEKPSAHAPVRTADRIVESYMREKHVPGLVLAVVRDGRLVVEKGYGIRSPRDREPPNPNTLFSIGSLSKAVTGVGIELLAERGKLDLDEPAGRHVPHLPPAWGRIPLKYYLAHQSGIPMIATSKAPTFAATIAPVAHEPLVFQPGSRQEYNNFNYAVAGQAIAGASGRPYLAFMRHEVFLPLGMTRTGYGEAGPNRSPGHYLHPNGRYEVVEHAVPKGGPYAIPSGFLQTTLADLLRLYRAIEHNTLFPAARTQEMITPVTDGLTGTPGWFARRAGGVTIVAKDGAASGYSSQFQFVPGRGDAVIFLMNLQHKDLATQALAHDLLREVCGLPLPQRPGELDAG